MTRPSWDRKSGLAGLALVALGLLLWGAMQAQATLRTETQRLTRERDQLATLLRQQREDAAAAEKLATLLTDEATQKLLAPVDRTRAVAALPPLADAARLSRFAYVIAPERPLPGGPEGLALTALTLQGEAPRDEDVFRFLDRAQKSLPGQARLRRLTLDRLDPTLRRPLSSANLRFSAALDWVSNASQGGAAR